MVISSQLPGSEPVAFKMDVCIENVEHIHPQKFHPTAYP